jgi:hypothetical protein
MKKNINTSLFTGFQESKIYVCKVGSLAALRNLGKVQT